MPRVFENGISVIGALNLKSTSANSLVFISNESLGANRTLNIITGDATRTLTFAGNATISGTNTGDQTTVSGNAGTATKLAATVTIAGQSFDGSANITITEDIGISLDGAGIVLTTGTKGFRPLDFNATIIGWTIIADQSGSIAFDIQKSTYSGFPTTSSIVASAAPALSSAQKNTSTTLTGWTTSISAGDILAFSVTSVTTVTKAILMLKIQRS